MRAPRLLLVLSLVASPLVPRAASADLYKYKKADGTVVYTDNLSQLPEERRAYYAKEKEAREQKRQELEKQIGKEELDRREAEARKAELQKAQLEEAERSARMKAIDQQLQQIQQRRREREASREAWRKRMQDAQKMLELRLKAFKAAQDRANELGMKPSYTLLPGEADELEKVRKDLARLEQEVDSAIQEVEVNIPDEARRAGVPPGYLR